MAADFPILPQNTDFNVTSERQITKALRNKYKAIIAIL